MFNPIIERMRASMRTMLVVLCAVALAAAAPLARAQTPSGTAAPAIPPNQLDSLVAPIALYPDPLLAQTLAASTYPLEIIQLQQFLARNPDLKDKALIDAVEKQPWDPSVQALAATPDLAKRLADDIQWTTDLGNAFLAQEGDVMAAVQRMRKAAVDKKVLKTTEQQVVSTKTVESQTVVVIEPADPQVIYVPSYSPTVVWGAPVYPYPPIYYPPAPAPGSLALAFGVGVAMGAWWGGGGGWGWNCGWNGGYGNVTINNNNAFVRNGNIRNGGNNLGNGNRWQHRPEHRGGAPYRDRATADRFGGATRGDSLTNRQSRARNDIGRQGGNIGSQRPGGDRGGLGGGDRGGLGGGNRGGLGGGDRGGLGGGDRGGLGGGNRGGVGGADRGGLGGNRGPAGPGQSRPGPSRGGAGGADRVGNRDLSRGGGGGGRNAFGGGGGGGGYNGSRARASSGRGAASRGGARGGGGRGGGGRGGGGRRR